MKKYLALLLAAVMALSLVACGSKTDDNNTGNNGDAVSYPTKTIEIICPFSTGGDTDALARALANEMT